MDFHNNSPHPLEGISKAGECAKTDVEIITRKGYSEKMIISGLTLVSMKMILCGWITDPKPGDKPKPFASPLPEELIALLDQLPSWLDGLSVFMSYSRELMHSQQQPVSDLLNMQTLIEQTSLMQKQAVALKKRYGTKTNKP